MTTHFIARVARHFEGFFDNAPEEQTKIGSVLTFETCREGLICFVVIQLKRATQNWENQEQDSREERRAPLLKSIFPKTVVVMDAGIELISLPPEHSRRL